MDLTRENLKSHLSNTKLIKNRDLILIAFSGGKDSTALLYLLHSLQAEMLLKIKAVYFNHRLRADSSVEEKWVQSVCQNLNIDLISSGEDVKFHALAQKKNLEETASRLRYTFFSTLLKTYPQAKIATAHTQSDQAETFLIKLLRGSGTEGLSGIFSKKQTHIIRPLLPFCQEDIVGFLKANRIKFYTDSSNRDQSYLRNQIRIDLLPRIKEISPRIEDHIEHTTNILHEELNYFQTLAKDHLQKKLLLGTILPLDSLSGLHKALQRHILREYIRKVKGNLLNLNFNHFLKLFDNINLSKNITLPDLDLKIKKGFMFPKKLNIEKISQVINLAGCPFQQKLRMIDKTIHIEVSETYCQPDDNKSVILLLQGLKFPLTLRSPQKGDKYFKINSPINQSVFEMIREQGSPKEFRDLYPVLTDRDGEIIWCFSSPVSDRFKVVNPNDSNFLKVSLK